MIYWPSKLHDELQFIKLLYLIPLGMKQPAGLPTLNVS